MSDSFGDVMLDRIYARSNDDEFESSCDYVHILISL